MGNAFKLSADGAQVYFSFAGGGAMFELEQRALILNPPAPREEFSPPLSRTPAMTVADWQGSYAPLLNGAQLPLLPYKRTESYALLPDDSGILLGTRWRVIRYGIDANVMWSFQAPGEAWALNITPDGRLAAGAFGDGSIR